MAVAFVRDHVDEFVKSAGTTDTYALTSNVAAGNLLVAVSVFDNAGTASKPVISSISKMAGETNNWVFLGAARSTSTSSGAFSSGEMWAIQTTVQWNNATSLTFTYDTSITMKAQDILEFSGALAVLRSTIGSAYSTTTTAASAVTTGTTPVIGDLAVGLLWGSNTPTAQAGDTDTTGGSWSTKVDVGSTGSTTNSNNYGIVQYKILTGANHQTFNNSAAMTAGNGSVVAILQQYVPPIPLALSDNIGLTDSATTVLTSIAITQAAYRFYADGTETGSTALAAQDAGYTADLSSGDVNLLLRMRLQSTTAVDIPAADDFQLQWEKNASGTWHSIGQTIVADTYSETNANQYLVMENIDTYIGQSFLGVGARLKRAGFYMLKTGTPPGNIYAALYAHDAGPFGDWGTGTGAALTTSTSRVCTTFSVTPQWEYFDFDGLTALVRDMPYIIVIGIDTSTAIGNAVSFGRDISAPTHPGTGQFFDGSWAAESYDSIFIVNVTTGVEPYNSSNLTDAAVTTNRLTGGTGSFTAGKVSEDTLADDVGWSGNNHTEFLYALTLKKADLANADVLRFRVLRNGATTGLTYTQVPTITVAITAGAALTHDTQDSIGLTDFGVLVRDAVLDLPSDSADLVDSVSTQLIVPIPLPLSEAIGLTDSVSTVKAINLNITDVASMLRDGGGHNILGIESSFETDTNVDGVADGWRVRVAESSSQVPNATALVGVVSGGHGASSQSVTKSSGSSHALLFGPQIAVVPEGRVRFVGRIHNPGAGSVDARFGYYQYNAADSPTFAVVGQFTVGAGQTITTSPGGGSALDASTVFLRIAIGVDSAYNATLIFDSIMVCDSRSGTLPAYDYYDPQNRIQLIPAVIPLDLSESVGLSESVEVARSVQLDLSESVGLTDSVSVQPIVTGGKPKVWMGSSWELKPAKVWDGDSWEEKPMKVWSGSSWELV